MVVSPNSRLESNKEEGRRSLISPPAYGSCALYREIKVETPYTEKSKFLKGLIYIYIWQSRVVFETSIIDIAARVRVMRELFCLVLMVPIIVNLLFMGS